MQNEDLEIVTIAEVAKMLRRSRASIRNDIRCGRMPQPILLGPRHRVWLRANILEYLRGCGACAPRGDAR